MASNIGDIRNKVTPRLQDEVGKLSVAPPMTCEVDRAILGALEKYSKDRPRERAARVAGTGAFKYALTGAPVLPGFIDGSSGVARVAYPHLTTDQRLPWLEDDEVGIVRDADGLWLWFAAATPSAAEFFLAIYTVPHTLDETSSTVPATDDEALADLGAAEGHDMLAALYSKATDGAHSADTVNHMSKAAEHRAMATRYRKSYAEKIGSEGATKGAFAMAEADQAFSNEARDDFFFHGRRRR